MTLKLYQNTSANNVIHKNTTLLATIDCEIKEDGFSIINPIVTISRKHFNNANYCRIEEYGRYYFISDIKLLFGNRIQLTLDSDDICNADFTNIKGLCVRNEFVGLSGQIDSMLPLDSSVETSVVEFTNGFSDKLQYVLTVLGGRKI